MNTTLIVLVSILALGAAQMTFSDGWEKRSASRPYAHHYAHQKRSGGHSFHEADVAADESGAEQSSQKQDAPMTPVTNCMEEYMVGVRELHAAMMVLYNRFETCENAMINPLLPGSHENTSPALF